jgi:hypothetical protein
LQYEKARAQPIGISAAPNTTGPARGEGERLAGRHDKPRWWSLFLVSHVRIRSQTVLQNQIANHAGVFERNGFSSRLSEGMPVTEQLPPDRVDVAVRLPARGLLARPIE